ncbi:DoxX family protein [Flavobacteriaceae bacterium F89]|uniref:DoxX family protein n=1 Tax=Cerina litoralis TaxID=2874477 RepID=A0AAE3EU50_9FLAO|nr:DoxX family protein [Cerina litoralis]MCG2461165.1 DoxX family protein [Cerina litoralis]
MKGTLDFLVRKWNMGHDTGLLIFRLVLGIVLIYGHGFKKMSVILSGQEIQFLDPIGIGASTSFYLAAFAEGICSILLILGLFSRIATLILSMNFLVIVIFHAFMVGDGFAILELRFLYLFSFIALTLTGPGKWSLDYILFQGNNKLDKT